MKKILLSRDMEDLDLLVIIGGMKLLVYKSLHFCVIKGGMFTFVAFFGHALILKSPK